MGIPYQRTSKKTKAYIVRPCKKGKILATNTSFIATFETTCFILGCVFNVIDNETEKNQPVPLYNVSSEYDLAIPHQGLIHLGPGQKICLLCSGNRNYVRQSKYPDKTSSIPVTAVNFLLNLL